MLQDYKSIETKKIKN